VRLKIGSPHSLWILHFEFVVHGAELQSTGPPLLATQNPERLEPALIAAVIRQTDGPGFFQTELGLQDLI